MEHIIANQIRSYLDKHNLITDPQHGFRKHRSCETQLVTTIHDINKKVDLGEEMNAIVLDFSKAFGKVSHPKLIFKLHNLSVSTQIINWIAQWLTDRTLVVVVNGTKSSQVPTLSGILQGSVLGPLLFVIFIIDIDLNIKNQIQLFVDDTLLFGTVFDTK